jgi:regulator of protease activity HflC (stomatin/prohibitin superfamily)
MLSLHPLADIMWKASHVGVATLWNYWITMPLVAALLALFALIAAIALAGLRRVPEDTVCTVHRFGRFVRALGPGIHFTWPLLDQIAHRVALIGHQVELPLDGSHGAATVYFQILEPERAGAALDQVDAMVEREALCRLRELVLNHADGSLAASLKQELNASLGALGLRVTRCQLRGA